MTSNDTSPSISYSGIFHHGVDDKRRVQVPADWRPRKEGTKFSLIVWPKHPAGPCLRAMPPAKWEKLQKDLDDLPNTDPSKGVLKRFIGNRSIQVPLDKAGRICLPEGMVSAAGIGDKAVFSGRLDQFEIWSPDRFNKVFASDDAMAVEAFNRID